MHRARREQGRQGVSTTLERLTVGGVVVSGKIPDLELYVVVVGHVLNVQALSVALTPSMIRGCTGGGVVIRSSWQPLWRVLGCAPRVQTPLVQQATGQKPRGLFET